MARVHPSRVEAEVLEVNAAFYRAFSEGDFIAMSGLWAETAPVACLHPGSQGVFGRSTVLASWKQILKRNPPFELRCDQPRVHVLGDTAIVSCYEASGDHPAHLAATNVFVREGGGWRIVHHQAGPLAAPRPRPAKPPSSLVN